MMSRVGCHYEMRDVGAWFRMHSLFAHLMRRVQDSDISEKIFERSSSSQTGKHTKTSPSIEKRLRASRPKIGVDDVNAISFSCKRP